jgi:hypothetical protein
VPILSDGEVTGDKTVVLRLSDAGDGVGPVNTATLTIRETDVDQVGPRMVNVQFTGGSNVTAIVLSFDEALDLAAAQNPANYSLVGTGRGAASGAIPISSAVYDPAALTVTLVPSRPLPNGASFTLSLNAGLTDRFGNALDGNGDGVRGDASVVTFTRDKNLSYRDPDGDVVTLRLSGPGIIEIVRGTDAAINRIRLAGARPRSTLSGNVRRGRFGDGVTQLGTVEGLGPFTGGARSRLTSPPFFAAIESLPVASLARSLGRLAARRASRLSR